MKIKILKLVTIQIFFIHLQSSATEISDTIIVSKDGMGQFITLQDALYSINCYSSKTTYILIKKGVYKEKLSLPATVGKVKMIGENCNNTIISFNDFSGKVDNGDTLTTHNSFTFRTAADNFEAENLTFENTAGQIAQAVAVEVKADKIVFRNCRFLGNQDTFYANSEGRIYLKNCYIEGTTDFIFGKSIVLFDNCIIFSKKDSYITAASTPEGTHYGFVFLDCMLKSDTGITKVYLGRPWRSFARTVLINCYLDKHILPQGWNNWSNPEKEKKVYYGEYNSIGPGAINISERVKWSHQLTSQEAAQYSIDKVFSKKSSNINFPDNWIP